MKGCAFLSVYFSGTDGIIYNGQTQISLFALLTLGQDITNCSIPVLRESDHFKMMFDGCGVTHGLAGALFGQGLYEQCDSVVERVRTLMTFRQHVVVNAMGLSRGGVAAMALAKKMSFLPHHRLDINLVVFDPVPGNSLTSSSLDWFNFTLANQCVDLTEATHLRNVLALYPHEPLPHSTLHAPIVPKWPTSCNVLADVILGCHQEALTMRSDSLPCLLSFLYINKFLRKCGTLLDKGIERYFENANERALCGLNLEFVKHDTTYRHTHPYSGPDIIRDSRGEYLNKMHEYLVAKCGGNRLAFIEDNESTRLIREKYTLRFTQHSEIGNRTVSRFFSEIMQYN